MPTGGEYVGRGLAGAGAGLAEGLYKRFDREFALQEREKKAQTLADLIRSAQTQFTGYDEMGAQGPVTGAPQFESTYPMPEELPPDLVKRAGEYDLLDFYLNLRKSREPQFKVEDGSILKFPAMGGTPKIVGQLPAKQKMYSPQQQAYMDIYTSLVEQGVPHDRAMAAAEKAMVAGKKELVGAQGEQRVIQIRAKGLIDKTLAEMNNASKERIAKMRNAASRYAADRAAGRKSDKVSLVVSAYPGTIGGAMRRDEYTYDPEKPETIQAVIDQTNLRLNQLTAEALASDEQKSAKLKEPSTWKYAFRNDDAGALWNEFIRQFEPDYEPLEGEKPLTTTDLPGDLEIMGKEYINLIEQKKFLMDTYGLAPAVEAAPGETQTGEGGSPSGAPPTIQEMRDFLKNYTLQMGGDTSMVGRTSDTDIMKAYEQVTNPDIEEE